MPDYLLLSMALQALTAHRNIEKFAAGLSVIIPTGLLGRNTKVVKSRQIRRQQKFFPGTTLFNKVARDASCSIDFGGENGAPSESKRSPLEYIYRIIK